MPTSNQRLFRRFLPFLIILPILLTLRALANENAPISNPTGFSDVLHLPLVQKEGSPPPTPTPTPPPPPLPTIPLISSGAAWKYLDNGSDQGSAWRASSFDDSSWNQGNAQLGYGDGDEATLVGFGPDPLNKYITTYFRHTFTVTKLAEITLLDFHLLRDDGAVVYLNGQEVIRSNMPAMTITYQTLAPLTMGLVGETKWHPYTADASLLVPGTNVVAVEIHQNTANSSDISFDVSLTGLTESTDEMTRFAVIGDYGKNTPEELAVATLVENWAPDYVITLGDNNYPAGEQATIEANIDAYYGDFIENTFETTRFFPSLGNHDWGDEAIISITCTFSICDGPYLDHFDLPGNERYYDFVKGPVHFFVLDSDPQEPDGNTMTSLQATWLQNQLASASEPWKVVYFHHAPYSSGEHGNFPPMQWPFEAWGASLVLSGHDHNYERLIVDGFPYFVNGSGGTNLRPCGIPIAGSQICFDTDHGAMFVSADACHITLTFTTQTSTDIDTILLENGRCP